MDESKSLDFQAIQQSLSSTLPFSVERAAAVIKRAIGYFPDLKTKMESGSPEEQANAKKIARMVIQIVTDESNSTCQALHLSVGTLYNQFLNYWSLADKQLYQDAAKYIQSHRDVIFPAPHTDKTKIMKSSRLYG